MRKYNYPDENGLEKNLKKHSILCFHIHFTSRLANFFCCYIQPPIFGKRISLKPSPDKCCKTHPGLGGQQTSFVLPLSTSSRRFFVKVFVLQKLLQKILKLKNVAQEANTVNNTQATLYLNFNIDQILFVIDRNFVCMFATKILPL